MQKILNQLSWRAVPLKQLSATAWVVGCMEKDHPPTDVFQFADKPVLVSKQGTKVSRAPEDVVLAAPPAVKKALGVQISRGTWRTPAAIVPDTQMDSSQPGPMRSLLAEFRDEVNARFGDFQAQIQGAVNHVNEKVGGLESQVASASPCSMEASAAVATCESKLQHLESSLQQLSANIATQADLTGALQQAMEHQSKELRLVLAQRSPDVTPTNESKLPRNN